MRTTHSNNKLRFTKQGVIEAIGFGILLAFIVIITILAFGLGN